MPIELRQNPFAKSARRAGDTKLKRDERTVVREKLQRSQYEPCSRRRSLPSFAIGCIGFLAMTCAPPVRVAVSPAPPVVTQREEGARWQLLRAPIVPIFISRVPSDSPRLERFIVSGDRAERKDGQLKFAKQSFLHRIDESCPSGSGFIHFVDGKVYWSKTFLDDAVEVGTSNNPSAGLGIEECGPVVIVNPERQGGKPFERWDEQGVHVLSGSKGLTHVHFTTPERGRAIRAPDQLFVTNDGGQTFVTPAEQPYPKAPEDWIQYRRAPIDPKEPDGLVAEPIKTKLQAAWLHRAMSSDFTAMLDATRLTDGTWVRSYKLGSKFLVSLRRPDGTIIDREVSERCSLVPFKDSLIAHCAEIRLAYPEQRRLRELESAQGLGKIIADSENGALVAHVCGDESDQ